MGRALQVVSYLPSIAVHRCPPRRQEAAASYLASAAKATTTGRPGLLPVGRARCRGPEGRAAALRPSRCSSGGRVWPARDATLHGVC